MKRDGIDHEQAAEKIAAQMPLKKKQKLADIVIDNSGSPAQTKLQVSKHTCTRMLSHLLQQAATTRNQIVVIQPNVVIS